MARRGNLQWYSHDEPQNRDHLGRRPPLASTGGPAGTPKHKRRDTKPKRKRRR